jgi:HEAT repeat protein
MTDLLLSVKIWSNCQGLKNKNWDARQKAAQALQEIGAPAVDALIKMLDSKE